MLYALEKAKLIKKIRRGRKGLKVEIMPFQILDELIFKLLKAEVIYITELGERIKIIEELKEHRNGERNEKKEEPLKEPESELKAYKPEDISDELLDF